MFGVLALMVCHQRTHVWVSLKGQADQTLIHSAGTGRYFEICYSYMCCEGGNYLSLHLWVTINIWIIVDACRFFFFHTRTSIHIHSLIVSVLRENVIRKKQTLLAVIYLSVCLSVCLICLVYLFARSPVCQSDYLSAFLSSFVSICLSTYLYVRPSICTSLHLRALVFHLCAR